MPDAIKKPGDELREGQRVGAPPKQPTTREQQVGETADEAGVTRGQNGEKGNTTRPENIRTGDKAAH